MDAALPSLTAGPKSHATAASGTDKRGCDHRRSLFVIGMTLVVAKSSPRAREPCPIWRSAPQPFRAGRSRCRFWSHRRRRTARHARRFPRYPFLRTYPLRNKDSAPSPVTLQAVPKLSCKAKMVSTSAVPVASKPRTPVIRPSEAMTVPPGTPGAPIGEHAQKQAEQNHGTQIGHSAVKHLGDGHHEEDLGEAPNRTGGCWRTAECQNSPYRVATAARPYSRTAARRQAWRQTTWCRPPSNTPGHNA